MIYKCGARSSTRCKLEHNSVRFWLRGRREMLRLVICRGTQFHWQHTIFYYFTGEALFLVILIFYDILQIKIVDLLLLFSHFIFIYMNKLSINCSLLFFCHFHKFFYSAIYINLSIFFFSGSSFEMKTPFRFPFKMF